MQQYMHGYDTSGWTTPKLMIMYRLPLTQSLHPYILLPQTYVSLAAHWYLQQGIDLAAAAVFDKGWKVLNGHLQ